MNYYFITGHSRGIGRAVSEALLEEPHHVVYGISRTADWTHVRLKAVSMDLSDPAAVNGWEFPGLEDAESIVLFNNAGTLGEVKYCGGLRDGVAEAALQVNLVAPVVLANKFLRAYERRGVPLVIVNVSSGAASSAIDGWSLYCASKAGLDHFSRTVAAELEIAGKTHIRIFSVAPGIVDTAMQDEIRKVSPLEFSRLQQFKTYKETNQLVEPALIARKFLSILGNPKKYRETVFSLRDL
jgi:benzil reductase ((S)-benzoin forming)